MNKPVILIDSTTSTNNAMSANAGRHKNTTDMTSAPNMSSSTANFVNRKYGSE